MARKTFDELIDDYNAAEDKPAVETTEEPAVDETTTATEETPADEPHEEPKPAEEPKPEETPAEEPKPADPVMEELENTNSVIRKRLEKQAKKFEEEKVKLKAEWEAGFEDRVKAAVEEELKKRSEKPKMKTRDDFQFDEEYIKYLNEANVNEILDAREKAKAEKDAADAAEAEKKKAEDEAAQAELRQRQNRFLANIDECFEGDAKDTFLKRVQYANTKGFGELLDANPIAFDYLLSSPKGPFVLNKILDATNPEYFRRVFPVGGISPLEQFSELKEIERAVMAERAAPAENKVPDAVKAAPKIGKPGVQGQGGTGGDPMLDPKQRRDYVRNLLYGHK